LCIKWSKVNNYWRYKTIMFYINVLYETSLIDGEPVKNNAGPARGSRSELRLESFLPYVLANLAQGISVELSGIYSEKFGLSVPEWRVLANLAEHQSLNARQIVSFTAMAKSKVSRAVASLDQRGLLSQRTASGDSRAKDLTLTEAGITLYREIVPSVLAWEQSLLEGLEVGEYRDLLYLLDKLGKRLQSGGTGKLEEAAKAGAAATDGVS
jgi:DNA-binding MarR family transcriptional regulator